jgi:hypothetical protein
VIKITGIALGWIGSLTALALPDWHRRPERYPPRLGDAVKVTSVQIWAPLDPAYLQKVPKQFVTHGDQLENRHPIALHKELQNFSLTVGRIRLHHS